MDFGHFLISFIMSLTNRSEELILIQIAKVTLTISTSRCEPMSRLQSYIAGKDGLYLFAKFMPALC